MKKLAVIAVGMVFLLCSAAVSVAASSGDQGCKAKEQALEKRLAAARQHNNTEQIEGLQKALHNIRTWCTDNNLKAKADYEVWEKQNEVQEREQELNQARTDGKKKKIVQRERKLDKARQKLREAQAKRDALQ